MSMMQQVGSFNVTEYVPAVLHSDVAVCKDAYELNRHRVYALAFWMTDNEMAAEELMTAAFCRACEKTNSPSSEEIDRALLCTLREYMPIGTLSLECTPSGKVLSVRRNTLRVDLERAVVQLPNTEKLIFLMHDVERYDHARIARILGLTEHQSRYGLHQARLRIRELLAS